MNIELTWTCTFQEYRQLNRAHAAAVAAMPVKHQNSLIPSPKTERRLLLVGIAIVSIIAYLGLANWTGNSLLTLLLGILILTPLVWLWWNPNSRARFQDAWLNNASFREPITFFFTADGLTRASTDMKVTIQWCAISFVYEDDFFLLLFRGTQLVMAIPKRIFKSEDDLRSFRQQCKSATSGNTAASPVGAS